MDYPGIARPLLDNLSIFKELEIQHLSAYHLTIEKGTPFFKIKELGGMVELPESTSLDQYRLLCSAMQDAGFEHYEVSNFCKPGYYSRHNSAYWKGVPYLGFGPGSHSYVGKKRFWNGTNLGAYLGQNFSLLYREEVLTNEDLFNERIMLGLRTEWGVDLEGCRRDFPEFYNKFEVKINNWCQTGLLVHDGTYLKCSEEKWFQVDGIIEGLMILKE